MSSSEANSLETRWPPWLGVVVVALLLPFVGKAIHIDDPLFVWSAQQILVSPLDFYGFDVNWYGVRESMAQVNKNPPLVAYYLALVGAVFGFGEVALHLGMMLPALALAYGVVALSRELGIEGSVAALCTLATPAFLVAATSLMSDVTMLALAVWGLTLGVRAIDREAQGLACASGALLGAAVLTKYFAVAFLPLMAVYAVAKGRRGAPWVAIAGVSVALIAGFDALYAARYGLHPIVDVVDYATTVDSPLGASVGHRVAVGLLFFGGCTLGPALLAPGLWSLREFAMVSLVGGLVAALCVRIVAPSTEHFDLALQQGLFAWIGVHWLALCVRELRSERDAAAVLIVCWIAGVFVFASFTNWTTNGRSILPAVPAIGMLVARGLARRGPVPRARTAVAFALAFALAWAVAWGDARLAGSARAAAQAFAEQRTGASPEQRVVFQGSWGFQYYMEEHGFEKFEVGVDELRPGDRMVLPGNNTNLVRIPEGRTRKPEIQTFEKADWISLLARRRSAGYHASVWGVLPFSFGPSVPARYAVYEFERPWILRRKSSPSG